MQRAGRVGSRTPVRRPIYAGNQMETPMPTQNPAPGFARTPAKVITIMPHPGNVTVRAGNVVIARSGSAKLLAETPYPAMIYIPFADIDFSKLAKTAHATHCPYKGDASYWSVLPAGEKGGQRDVGL